MQTFDREHSVWARFDVQERRKVDEYCKNFHLKEKVFEEGDRISY